MTGGGGGGQVCFHPDPCLHPDPVPDLDLYPHFGSFVFSDLLGNNISNSIFQSMTCFGIQP